VSLATTLPESIQYRREKIQDALYHRRHGNRKAMLAALNCARCEKINLKYFLGPAPF
jgi:hypothetical protein